jgi:hypothetical protein
LGKINNLFKVLKKELFEEHWEFGKGKAGVIVFIGFKKEHFCIKREKNYSSPSRLRLPE